MDLVECLVLARERSGDGVDLAGLVGGTAYLPAERLDAVRHDIELLARSDPQTVLPKPVWISVPTKAEAQLDAIWAYTEDSGLGEAFQFWRAWYDGVLRGRPMNWALQRDVALIPEGEWQKGAGHIAEIIAGIEADYVKARTPYAMTVEIEEDSQLLVARPVPMANAALYSTGLERVRYTMRKMRPDGVLPQSYVFAAPVFERLDDAFGQYAGNPQWMHDEFLLSAGQLRGLVERCEIQGDDRVGALSSALVNGADDIRAADDVVRASVSARMQLRIDELRVEDTQDIAEAFDAVADVSKGGMKAALIDSAKVLRAGRDAPDSARALGPADPAERLDALYSGGALVSRSWEALGELSRRLEKLGEDYDKATKVTTAIKAAGSLLAWFVRILGGG